MSLPLKLNFSDYDNFLTEPNYTTSAEAQDYFRNMDMLVEALIDVGLWQPETNYPNGHVVFSPNMPNSTEAVCVTTNGGKSSNVEPSWGEVGGDNVSDGTCFWKLRWKHWSKENATNRLPDTTYAVGDVMLHKSNLSVALKCTTAGTTSNTELDISGVSVGESVTDGSAGWVVVPRFLPAETINELANELIEELFVGFIGTYAGNTPPTGWLACSGASLNPQTYTRLFGRIGTIYGGNGTTTFNLPNMGTQLVSSITNSNIPIKGNGIAVGLTNGSNNGGLQSYNGAYIAATVNCYGARVSTSSAHGTFLERSVLGLTTDASKSGMVANMIATKTTVKYCIKY